MKISHTATPSGKIIEYSEPDTVEKIMDDYHRNAKKYELTEGDIVLIVSMVLGLWGAIVWGVLN